jgi:SAM-dependent MidA family methyltransferase
MASLPQPSAEAQSHSDQLCATLRSDIAAHGGWIPFARFMALALYAPGQGYYSAGAAKFGADGDFVTAPELSPLFGQTLARQVAEIMAHSAPALLELGAGSGKLAADVLGELEQLGCLPQHYDILEVSADLRQRQNQYLTARVPHLVNRVRWTDTLPATIAGAVIANEVLDALPVHLLRWTDSGLLERGVGCQNGRFVWQERTLENPALIDAAQAIHVPHDYLSEISPAAQGLVASLCARLQQGVLLFVDYGFGSDEYYHAQRKFGTLMCHYRHHAHDDPFFLPGLQDITAHVDFTAIAECAVDNGAQLLGYTTQAHFLINCGITDLLAARDPENMRDYLPLSAQLQKLTSPAEMGELFKVIALGKGVEQALRGFRSGDRSRMLGRMPSE